MAVRHGTMTAYNEGCRCDVCVKCSREYRKSLYQRNKARKLSAAPDFTPERRNVTTLPAPDAERAAGAVEIGVLAEIDGLSTADSRKGLVEVALALALVLDNPIAIAQHPSAAHRLSETLDKIRKGSDSKTSKLASVRMMSRPAKAVG